MTEPFVSFASKHICISRPVYFKAVYSAERCHIFIGPKYQLHITQRIQHIVQEGPAIQALYEIHQKSMWKSVKAGTKSQRRRYATGLYVFKQFVYFIDVDSLTFSGVKMFLTHHYYEGTVSYLPATDIIGTPRDAARCRSG